MRPLKFPEADSSLSSISFTLIERVEQNSVVPIAVERASFIAMWSPTIRERARLLFGAPVRVLVNYSTHGPMHLDTERRWGDSSRLDW